MILYRNIRGCLWGFTNQNALIHKYWFIIFVIIYLFKHLLEYFICISFSYSFPKAITEKLHGHRSKTKTSNVVFLKVFKKFLPN